MADDIKVLIHAFAKYNYYRSWFLDDSNEYMTQVSKFMIVKHFAVIGAIFSVFAMSLSSCQSEMRYDVKEIQFTNIYGDTYQETAVPEQVIIMFVEGVSERIQYQIISECGGEILEYYPLLDSYLVKTIASMEMDFITKARYYSEVQDVHLNIVSSPMSNMYVMDIFKGEYENDKNNVSLSHGDYCYYAARTAYPECPDCINEISCDFKNLASFFDSPLSSRNQIQYLNDIFDRSDSETLILINMSYGRKLGNEERQMWDECNKNERSDYVNGYIDEIRSLANYLLKLSEYNPNFIIFKAAGNAGCHVMDEVIFNKLDDLLTRQQLDIIKKHVLYVGAKDDDFEGIEKLPMDKTKLYAYYSNSPAQYCPYMSMVDITQLYVSGTSFAAPYLLGKAARLFDMKGYRPMSRTMGYGLTVEDVVKHIKDETREYARSIQQPGIYTETYDSGPYYYGNRYSFSGILRCDYEDLCETGHPERFYYIEIAPIDIQVAEEDDIFEPLSNVTRLQLTQMNLSPEKIHSAIGQKIEVVGELWYHIAGCHIHTDAYLLGCNIVISHSPI